MIFQDRVTIKGMVIVRQKITNQDLNLARHLQQVRKSKKITQEQLAEQVKVSTTWIGYIDMGRFRPSLRLLYKIAKALNVPVRDLFPF